MALHRKKVMKILLLMLAIWIALPIAISFARYSPPAYSWSTAPRHSPSTTGCCNT